MICSAAVFVSADFELFQARFQSDPEWNARRLAVRQRLQALGTRVQEAWARGKIKLDRRESLHHPHATNGKRVRRQRTMLFRDRKARSALQRFLGKELGKDLDSAVNNLHLQAGLDDRRFYYGLRVDRGAWYDLNVLLKRAEEPPGREEIVAACRAAPGFELEVDGRGARPLEAMSSRDWQDLTTKVLRPGESTLDLVRRVPADEVAAAGEEFEGRVVSGLESLIPFYRLACWSLDGSCPSGASL